MATSVVVPAGRNRSFAMLEIASWPSILRWTAVFTLVGAEAIHVSVIETHFYEWFWAGVFFWMVAGLEGLLAAGLIFVPDRRAYVLALVLSLATVAVWVVSRTSGIPFGPSPWIPESIGRSDVISTLFELLTAGSLLPLILTEKFRRAPGSRAPLALVLICLGVVVLSWLAVTAGGG